MSSSFTGFTARNGVKEVNDIFDKSYKQLEDGYKLPVTTNRIVVARLKNYPKYVEQIQKIRDKSEHRLTQKDIARISDLERLIESMDKALYFIGEDYREAIRERLEKQTAWGRLAEKYGYSESYLRIQWQRYKYGAAIELGEDVID